MAASSSAQQDPTLPPGPPLLQLQAPPPPPSSRRLPPPCWSHEETVALIDSYRDKWYSLRRGNLKAPHWQEVADSVSRRCPLASPSKTAVQCRHKMEKLRKRYRTEIQRARSMPVSRFSSSWVHFKRMDSMEKGPAAENPAADSGSEDNEDADADEDDDDRVMYQDSLKNGSTNTRSVYGLMSNGIRGGSSGGSGFRIRIPSGVSVAKPGTGFRTKNYGKFDQNPNPNLNPNLGTRVLRDGAWARPGLGKRGGGGGGGGGVSGDGMGKREREGDVVAEMVSALKVLGDGFVKMEQTRMEMAREIETMRMEMEMKRTEMILESQQQIVEAFAKAVSEKKKKAKRMPSPES